MGTGQDLGFVVMTGLKVMYKAWSKLWGHANDTWNKILSDMHMDNRELSCLLSSDSPDL